MAVQFSTERLDYLLAPEISGLATIEIPDLEEFPEEQHWISNLFLNSLFGSQYREAWKQAAVTFLFRTQNARRSYRLAREKSIECVAGFQPGRPKTGIYFEAVSHWETSLLNVQIALDLFLKFMDPGTAETEDATRIRRAAARVKHFAEDIVDGKNSGDLTLPIWLEHDRLQTRTAYVLFEELAENLKEMAKAADILQNPNLSPVS